jgi:N-acetyl-anhydromuramoyl-L-alanine amidase
MTLSINQGWLSGEHVRHVPSPNFNQRPHGQIPRVIVIHNISLPPAQFGGGYIEAFFQNRLDPQAHPYFATIADLKVSAHLLILRTGDVIQFVSCDARAWHAGRSSYCGVDNCNDFSIGIELEGTDDMPFTDMQYHALIPMLATLHQQYPQTRRHLTGHSDIAPQRKTDPGSHFDWQRVRQQLHQHIQGLLHE